MPHQFTGQLEGHIKFSYSGFDRVLLRGYLPNLFVEGSVISLLRNLGFSGHSNGVLRTLTDQLNSHIEMVKHRVFILSEVEGNVYYP